MSNRTKKKNATKSNAISVVLRHNGLSLCEKYVMLFLIDVSRWCSNDNLEKGGYARMGFQSEGYFSRYTQANIAKYAGKGKSAISKAITKLDEKNWITRGNKHSIGCSSAKRKRPSCVRVNINVICEPIP